MESQKTDQDLVASYIAQELTGDALTNFENRLETEPELKQQVAVAILVRLAFTPNPIAKARKIVDTLGDDLFADSEAAPTVTGTSSATYTLNELRAFFSPEPNLETAAVNRGSEQEAQNPMEQLVILPENEVNIIGSSLLFVFEHILPHPVLLEILNNREDVIVDAGIAAGASSYNCEVEHLTPGRYYWRLRLQATDRKLNREFGTATGSFLKNGQLLPPV